MINTFIKTFDFLSYEAYLFVEDSKRKKTIFSAIVSLLVIVSISILSVLFLKDSLSGKRPNIIINSNEDIYPIAN